ncbi:TPA: hypothetical protein ACKC7X_000826 [Streptococcus pneumoniae]
MVLAIILVTFLIRLIFLKRSIENEKRILSNGGKEFGVENTKRLTLAHIVFYLSCAEEEKLLHEVIIPNGSIKR